MKIIYVNYGLVIEYDSGLCNNEHYLSSGGSRAWKKLGCTECDNGAMLNQLR